MIVRTATVEDAPGLCALRIQLAKETDFMLPTLEEAQQASIKGQYEMLKSLIDHDRSTMIVAEENGTLVGFAMAKGNFAIKLSHVASIVIGVTKEFWGKGAARLMMDQMHSWGAAAGLKRFELTVLTENVRAITFYRNLGYSEEGTRNRAVWMGAKFEDELYMGKRLDS